MNGLWARNAAAKLGREKARAGAAERLNAANATFNDWWKICRKCGLRRTGTLAELAEPCPRCAEEAANATGS